MSQSTIFQLCWEGSSWVEPVLRINVSCLSTQCSDAGEAQTLNPSVSSQALHQFLFYSNYPYSCISLHYNRICTTVPVKYWSASFWRRLLIWINTVCKILNWTRMEEIFVQFLDICVFALKKMEENLLVKFIDSITHFTCSASEKTIRLLL